VTFHGTEILNLAIAYVLALPTAWEREREERSAGMRTYPLLALASCAFVALGLVHFQSADAQSRVIQGLLSGMGLLAAGAIIQNRTHVHGTATAASMLGACALGAAAAFGDYDIALFLSLTIYTTLRVLRPLKRALHTEK
jgi:putative Mg2+ transporter-C (MgtC) family protein